MPVHLEYDKTKCLLYATITEEMNSKDIKDALTQIVTSTEYEPTVSVLWDMRSLSFEGANNNMPRELVKIREQFPQRGYARIALVVAGDLGFGLTRMHQILSDRLPQHIGVFKDITAAEKWLFDGD